MGLGTQYWIKENSLSETGENLDLNQDGKIDHFRFVLKNNCLHPIHPLGWFRSFRVLIDGTEVNPDDSYFVVRGQWIPFDQLPTITDIWWSITEPADIVCAVPEALYGKHTVSCVMSTSLVPNTRTVDTKGVWRELLIEVEAEISAQ